MTDLFREIDEDLRRDNLLKLWKRFGPHLIVGAVLIVVIASGILGCRENQKREREAEGARYVAAADLVRNGKTDEAQAAFAGIATSTTSGRAVLARLEAAGLKAKAGDAAGALSAYDAIAADSSIDRSFRDLATILSAINGLKAGDAKAIVDRLKPLTDAGSPWHGSALELTALAQLKGGDKEAARSTYQKLADDLSAPQSLRARAAEMVAALGT